MTISRRRFMGVAAVLIASTGCDDARRALSSVGGRPNQGRLAARPDRHPPSRVLPGVGHLGITDDDDALLAIPPVARDGRPVPLLVSLHGAGGGGEGLGRFRVAVDRGAALLVPHSRGPTWDLTFGGFGEDVEVIDRALAETFRRVRVDPAAIALAGFSDGASYAISLGLTNGDVFRSIIACSPGYSHPADLRGRPRLFVSHGRQDPVLPIDQTSHQIVPELRELGYDVRFLTFEGRHEVPPEILDAAMSWFLRSTG